MSLWVTTVYSAAIQSYKAAEREGLTTSSLTTQCTCSHVIIIWVLWSPACDYDVTASYVFSICDLPRCLPTSKVNSEARWKGCKLLL